MAGSLGLWIAFGIVLVVAIVALVLVFVYKKTGPAGTSFAWKGPWSSATTYALNDVVFDATSSSSFISIVASNFNHPPASSPTDWQVMVESTAGQGFTLSGTYSASTIYAAFDVVTDPASGSSYASLVSGNLNHPPSTSPSQWQLFAQGVLPSGTFSNTTTYAKGNIVFDLNSSSSYLSLINGNLGNPPSSSPSAWQVLASGISATNPPNQYLNLDLSTPFTVSSTSSTVVPFDTVVESVGTIRYATNTSTITIPTQQMYQVSVWVTVTAGTINSKQLLSLSWTPVGGSAVVLDEQSYSFTTTGGARTINLKSLGNFGAGDTLQVFTQGSSSGYVLSVAVANLLAIPTTNSVFSLTNSVAQTVPSGSQTPVVLDVVTELSNQGLLAKGVPAGSIVPNSNGWYWIIASVAYTGGSAVEPVQLDLFNVTGSSILVDTITQVLSDGTLQTQCTYLGYLANATTVQVRAFSDTTSLTIPIQGATLSAALVSSSPNASTRWMNASSQALVANTPLTLSYTTNVTTNNTAWTAPASNQTFTVPISGYYLLQVTGTMTGTSGSLGSLSILTGSSALVADSQYLNSDGTASWDIVIPVLLEQQQTITATALGNATGMAVTLTDISLSLVNLLD
jgi:hypothetical protein